MRETTTPRGFVTAAASPGHEDKRHLIAISDGWRYKLARNQDTGDFENTVKHQSQTLGVFRANGCFFGRSYGAGRV